MPDFVIANDTPVTADNLFVYPDAINLGTTQYVNDDVTPVGELTWSFLESTGKYTINEKATLASAGDAVAPGAAAFAGPGVTGDDSTSVDSNLFTITLRNVDLSPIGGPNQAPGATGILASETRAVTLFASDGDLAGSRTVMFYTDSGGQDRYSPEGVVTTPVVDYDFTAGANGWTYATVSGAATSSTSGGICVNVAAAGSNIGNWQSPYGDAPLVDNAVYLFRVDLTTNQNTLGQTPFWDVALTNSSSAGDGAALYGADFFVLDNLNSDYAVSNQSSLTFVWAPAAFQHASWRSSATGAFLPGFDQFNDFTVNFRLFDPGPASGDPDPIGFNNRSGTICLTNLAVERFDFSSVQEVETRFEQDTFVTSTGAAGQPLNGWQSTSSAGDTNFSASGGNLVLAPANPGTSWSNMINTLVPFGDGIIVIPGVTPWSQAEFDAAYPLQWNTDELLMMEMDLSTANPTTASPPDMLVPIFEAASVEVSALNLVQPGTVALNDTNNPPMAMPAQTGSGTTTYYNFLYTNDASTATGGFNQLRPRLDFYNFPELFGFGFQNPGTGNLVVERVAVKQVTAP